MDMGNAINPEKVKTLNPSLSVKHWNIRLLTEVD